MWHSVLSEFEVLGEWLLKPPLNVGAWAQETKRDRFRDLFGFMRERRASPHRQVNSGGPACRPDWGLED